MPQLNSSSSNETEPNALVDESKNVPKSKADPYKRRLRNRSKNPEPESSETVEQPDIPDTPAKKPAKKAVKRKSPAEKKPTAKSSKPRGSRKKASEKEATNEITHIDLPQTIKTEIEEDDDDEEDMEEGEIPSSIAAETRTYYSCKLCHKDFSSAFILCLHLQIHKKVASAIMAEEESTTVVTEESQNGTVVKIEKVEVVDENTGQVEEEKEEEEDDEDEPGLVKVENCQPSGLMNKNFVENLKRNLSLAMSRNNL